MVESFRPGVMNKLGVGYDVLAAKNPAIVVCSISGYGQTGPYVDRAGHDVDYIALAGVLAMSGVAGGAPQLPGVQIADLAGGALWGATAILGALVGRARTGKGAQLDISMTEGALALLAADVGNYDCGARPTRGVEVLNGGAACYGVYRTSDDRYLAVGALEPKFWIALNQAIGRPPVAAELIANAAEQARVRGELAQIFATRTAAEWHAALAHCDCCVEIVTELDELPAHPLHQAREVFFQIDGGPGSAPSGSHARRQARAPIAAAEARRSTPSRCSTTGQGRCPLRQLSAPITAKSLSRRGRTSTKIPS